MMRQFDYENRDDATWAGRVRYAKFIIRMPFTPEAHRVSELHVANAEDYTHWNRVKPWQVYYTGLASPRRVKRSLVYEGRDVKPADVDVHAYWSYVKGEKDIGM